MVEQKVAFIVPGKQLYIPFLVMHFTEKAERKAPKKVDKFRPVTQLMFLYHLQVHPLEHLNFGEIAQDIKYSNMSVSRAAEELQEFGLANITGKRNKQLVFVEKGKQLWDLAMPYLQSPVKIDFYINDLPDGIDGKTAGDNALAKYTNLASGIQPVMAIGPDQQKKLEAAVGFGIDYFDGLFHVEVWNYSPHILSETNIVDRLSLFLSKKFLPKDERLEISLEHLINDIKW
jgi:hypothetical protein